jgi:hypothetical protein
MDNNPFADLIPQQGQAMPAQAASNPFADLVPAQSAPTVPRENVAPQMSTPIADITAFNTGVGRFAHGILQPLFESGALGDRVSQASKSVAANREKNYQAAVDADPTGARIAEFIGNVAPTLALPVGGFAKNIATGVGIGAMQYVNPDQSRLANAALGGAGGALGTGAGKLFDLGIRKGAEKYAQSALPGLVEKATSKIKQYITPEQGAQKLQANFNTVNALNKANWNKTNTLAQGLDETLASQGKAFDASPFTNHIQEFSDKLKNMEPAVRAKYSQAADFANYIQDQAPQSFSGAVALRQNLNGELTKFLDKNNIKAADAEIKNLIKGLKDSLQSTVDAHSGKVDDGLLSQFKTAWEDANKSHQALTEFVKTPNPQGVLKPRVPRREALNNEALDTGALGQYLRPSLRGMSGINQLNKLTGSDDTARSYLMRNVIEGRGNPAAALTNYEKLAIPQRQALFDALPEGQSLKAASTVRNAFSPKEAPSAFDLAKHKLGALATGALTLGAAPLAKKAISRYATPQSVMRAVNRAQTPNQRAGRYLSPVLANLFASRGDNS